MKKLIPYRKIFLIVACAMTLILAVVQLIFGNSASSVSNTIMMVIIPLFVFAFFRFAFYMWSKKKLLGVVKFFSWFLLLGGAFFTFGGIIMTITNFPNVATPPLSIGLSMIVCVLYSNADLDNEDT